MKHFITLIAALLLIYGCRTIRDRHTTMEHYTGYQSQQSAVYWSHYDSTARYWRFQSDSPFYYHPDAGLYGNGGWLSVSERQLRQGELRLVQDSAAYQRGASSQERTIAEGRSLPKWLYAVGGLLVLLAIMLWKVNFRRR